MSCGTVYIVMRPCDDTYFKDGTPVAAYLSKEDAQADLDARNKGNTDPLFYPLYFVVSVNLGGEK